MDIVAIECHILNIYFIQKHKISAIEKNQLNCQEFECYMLVCCVKIDRFNNVWFTYGNGPKRQDY